MESLELGRKIKRNCENIVSKKRLALIILIGLVTLWYIVPIILQWYNAPVTIEDSIQVCLRDRLTGFAYDEKEFNVYVGYLPAAAKTRNLLGYVGNGYFGLDAIKEDQLYLRGGRQLSIPTDIYPTLHFQNNLGAPRSAYVVDYRSGIVHLFHCYQTGFYASFQYYAHRKTASLFVQEVKLSNPSDRNVDVILEPRPITNLVSVSTRSADIENAGEKSSYNITSGFVMDGDETDLGIPITLIHRNSPAIVKVEARNSKTLTLYTGVSYGRRRKIVDKSAAKEKTETEKALTADVKGAINEETRLKQQHVKAWNNLWTTGFSIETSKAKEALNGETINATMYYVLSQVKESTDSSEVISTLSYSEGCYGNHHTLEAQNLWGSLDSMDDVNRIVSYWLLTLEKNGCHKMARAGARGVAEAMVLSYGGLRFSNQHLEFNIDPKYLHRGCLFHRIAYGNKTHVNITVAVQEDNKAVLRVALDRSDKNYYACDAGCLDTPVLLGPEPVTFPVKLTEPLTPILYMTYDKQHMEELRKAIHVREIGLAPAHEHHVIALHKHGHHLGGLPTFFWVSVSILILIFHLFLFKLIYNEYYSSNNTFDRQRIRYGKL